MSLNIKEWHWEITTRCNLDCLDCITECGQPREDELSKEAAVRAIKVMKSLGCKTLMITGGEPFCCPFLHDVLHECGLRNIGVSVLTNGSALGRYFDQSYAGAIKSIGISLDGSSALINDKVRGVRSFDDARRAMLAVSSILPTSVYVVASNNNLDDLDAILGLAFRLGARTVHVSEVALIGRAFKNRDLFQLSQDQRRLLRIMAARKTGMEDPITGCSADFSSLYVSSTGLVYPCSEIAIRLPEINMGLIVEKGFRESLGQKQRLFVSGCDTCCCYDVYAGNNIVFILNSENVCALRER